MIHRLIGILFTFAALAVMAFAILNMGNYRSMCFNDSEDSVAKHTLITIDDAEEVVVEEAIVEDVVSEDVIVEEATEAAIEEIEAEPTTDTYIAG